MKYLKENDSYILSNTVETFKILVGLGWEDTSVKHGHLERLNRIGQAEKNFLDDNYKKGDRKVFLYSNGWTLYFDYQTSLKLYRGTKGGGQSHFLRTWEFDRDFIENNPNKKFSLKEVAKFSNI